MGKWGSADFSELKELQGRLERLEKADLDTFCREASRELAARLLSIVIPSTPLGKYPQSTGKKGGTLRRGWTAKTHEEAENGSADDPTVSGREYAKSLRITKSGNDYIIEVVNPVEYASYVEYGHRTVNGGWVEGRYFLTFAEHELEKIKDGVIERKLEKYLKEVLSG